jgi:DNA-binding winged helix-turn-helix (wHTH) protein
MNDFRTTIFVFPPFRLDPARRLLTREGQPIILKPKEFDTLLVLVKEDGRVVEKDDLIARVWPDSFVSDGSLARNISVLRKALGEEVIETHRGRGYRITVPAQVALSDTPGVTSHDAEPNAMKPAFGIGATSFSRRRLPIAIFAAVAVVAVTLFLARTFSMRRSTQAHGSVSTVPISSILIQKEGALDPLDEGFKLARPQGQYPQAIFNRETNGWDRWRIVSDDQNYYYRVLSAAERDFALRRDWNLTCVCAVESGAGEADIDLAGGPRFDMEFLQEGDRYFVALVNQLSPDMKWDQKIEFFGVGDIAHPHTYELRFDHFTQTASLWIDGQRKTSGYHGYHQFQDDSKPALSFGTFIYGHAPKGSFVSRRIRFEAN